MRERGVCGLFVFCNRGRRVMFETVSQCLLTLVPANPRVIDRHQYASWRLVCQGLAGSMPKLTRISAGGRSGFVPYVLNVGIVAGGESVPLHVATGRRTQSAEPRWPTASPRACGSHANLALSLLRTLSVVRPLRK